MRNAARSSSATRGGSRAPGSSSGSALAIRPSPRPATRATQPAPSTASTSPLVPEDAAFGELSKACGEAAYRFIERAVALALAGDVEAICTAPINKEALNAAGHRFPGHTEILAHLTGTAEVSLMLMAPGLRVIHVTTHIGLLDAIDRIDAGLVERTIARGRDLLRRAGTAEPRIASAASTRMRAKAASSAAARRRRRSRRRSAPAPRAAGRSKARCPPTRSSTARVKATSISSSRCTTTRGTGR